MYTSRQLAEIFLASSSPKRSLGQNFIIDDKVINSIYELAQLEKKNNCKILEIGLGPGALTQKLLESENKVVGVEIDNLVCKHISQIFRKEIESGNLELINGDVLDLKWPNGITDIIANIPYQISSPLLEKISHIVYNDNNLKNCIFMFQEEFAQRIYVGKFISNRGPLWISVSLDWDITLGIKIPPSSFMPQPKVHSRLVHLKRRDLLNSEKVKSFLKSKNLKTPSVRLIKAISFTSFNQRRKKLRNTLRRQPTKLKIRHGFNPKDWEKIINKAFLSMREFFSDCRPEELSLMDWIEFSAQIDHFKNFYQTST